MTQTLYFITQNGQPISMETWTDYERASAECEALNLCRRSPNNTPYEVHSRVTSDNASEATPITVAMGLLGATSAAKDGDAK